MTDADGQTYAVFGQGTYTLFEKLDLTAGLRATFDDRSIHGTVVNANPLGPVTVPAVNASADFSAVQPKFAAAWHFTPQTEIYAQRGPGLSKRRVQFLPQQQRLPAPPDPGNTNWASRIRVTTINIPPMRRCFTRTPGATRSSGSRRWTRWSPICSTPIGPPATGRNWSWPPNRWKNLELGAAAGYTRATYENFMDNQRRRPVQLAGQPISFVPEFTADLSATYRLPWHTYIRGDVIGIGRYHLDDTGALWSRADRARRYELVNLQVGVETKYFGACLFARNVLTAITSVTRKTLAPAPAPASSDPSARRSGNLGRGRHRAFLSCDALEIYEAALGVDPKQADADLFAQVQAAFAPDNAAFRRHA